jgi:thiol-disulfide isomerase/thioredoxin
MPFAAFCLICLCAKPAGLVLGLDGAMHSPLKSAGGEPLAFIFVNHDCPICNAYSPEIDRLVRAFSSKVKIELVYSEPEFTVVEAKAHAKEYSLAPMPTWIDENRTFASLCGATIVPEAVLYDARGTRVWAGRIDDQYVSLGVKKQRASVHDLHDALALLAQGKRPNPPSGKPVGCYILSPGTS